MPNYRGAPSARRRAQPGGRGRPALRGRGSLSREPARAGRCCEKQPPQSRSRHPVTPDSMGKRRPCRGRPPSPARRPGPGNQRMLVSLAARSPSPGRGGFNSIRHPGAGWIPQHDRRSRRGRVGTSVVKTPRGSQPAPSPSSTFMNSTPLSEGIMSHMENPNPSGWERGKGKRNIV